MTRDIQVRTARESDETAISLLGSSSFGRVSTPAQRARWREIFPLDRSLVAECDDKVIGHTVTTLFAMTVPGPEQVAAVGVSLVAVAATHRRLGVMRELFSEMHRKIEDSGVPLAVLTASEGGIYRRYGYYTAAHENTVSIDRRFAEFIPGVADPGGTEISQATGAQAQVRSIYERWQAITPGAQVRPPADWSAEFADETEFRDGGTELFAILHPDGYALIRFLRPRSILRVHELRAVTSEAHCALWRVLLAFDLYDTIEAALPTSDPLPYLLADPRLVHTTAREDTLWLRIIDIPAALTARRYLADLDLVLEVTDEFRGRGGRFRLQVRDGTGECGPTAATPDVSLSIDALSGMYLGAHAAQGFAAAGRLRGRDPAMVHKLSAAFATTREPQLGWGF